MNKLAPEKKKKIMIVGGVTLATLIILYMFVVAKQMDKTTDIETKIAEVEGKKYDMDQKIKTAGLKKDEFEKTKVFLAEKEKVMAGLQKADWKLWLRGQLQMVATNRASVMPGGTNRLAAHQVTLGEVQFAPTGAEVTAELLPKFPYLAVRFQLQITGYYQDIGKYIAAIENNFPFLRVENITLTPAVVVGDLVEGATKSEALTATVQIVTLAKNPQ